MRLLVFILLHGLLLAALGQSPALDSIKRLEREWKIDPTIEEHATLEGGEQALLKKVHTNLNFPDDDNSPCVLSSKIIIAALVNEAGGVEKVNVIKSICPEVDMQFVNLMKALKFKPAMKNGKPVRDIYFTPVQICLRR